MDHAFLPPTPANPYDGPPAASAAGPRIPAKEPPRCKTCGSPPRHPPYPLQSVSVGRHSVLMCDLCELRLEAYMSRVVNGMARVNGQPLPIRTPHPSSAGKKPPDSPG